MLRSHARVREGRGQKAEGRRHEVGMEDHPNLGPPRSGIRTYRPIRMEDQARQKIMPWDGMGWDGLGWDRIG